MNKTYRTALLWIDVNIYRRLTSPIWYWVLRYTKYFGKELPDKWKDIKDLPLEEFAKAIEVDAKYDYLDNFLSAFADFSPREKNFFFLDRTTSRECTAWSRMFKWWGEHNGYETHEIIIWRPRQAHALTVIKFDDGYECLDYRRTYKREKTIEDALRNNRVGYDEFVWVRLKG